MYARFAPAPTGRVYAGNLLRFLFTSSGERMRPRVLFPVSSQETPGVRRATPRPKVLGDGANDDTPMARGVPAPTDRILVFRQSSFLPNPTAGGKLRRMTNRAVIVTCVLGLLALLTLGGFSLVAKFHRQGSDPTIVGIPTSTPAMQNNPLLAVLRDFPGTVGEYEPAKTPQEEATRCAAAYARLEQQYRLVVGSLDKELVVFAEQLLARADISTIVRASALFAVGRLAECEATALQAKDEALAADGQTVQDAIAALDLAGIAAIQQHHFDQSIHHWRAAAALTDPDVNWYDWFFVQWRIAFALAANNRHHEAETVYRQIIAVQGRALGEEHPDTLTCRMNLANALWAQGKYPEGLSFIDRAELGWRKIFGPDAANFKDAKEIRERMEAAVNR